VMNGQVARNKEDIKGMKAFVTKMIATVGATISAVVSALFSFIK